MFVPFHNVALSVIFIGNGKRREYVSAGVGLHLRRRVKRSLGAMFLAHTFLVGAMLAFMVIACAALESDGGRMGSLRGSVCCDAAFPALFHVGCNTKSILGSRGH